MQAALSLQAKSGGAKRRVELWLDRVASGASTMSQRKVEALMHAGISLSLVRKLARERHVHIVKLTDDKGNELLAASLNVFRVIC